MCPRPLVKNPPLSRCGNLSRGAHDLSTILIPNESGLHFQLNPNPTPMSIAKLLNNHVFRTSPNLIDPQMVSTICHVIQSTEKATSFVFQAEGDLFGAANKR